MKIPNASNAVIAPEKLRDYLLNLDHRRGGSRARLLHSFGYDRDDWAHLERDLRDQHLVRDVARTRTSVYGVRYDIVGAINTPSGRSLRLRSIRQIDTGSDTPRLITMFPE